MFQASRFVLVTVAVAATLGGGFGTIGLPPLPGPIPAPGTSIDGKIDITASANETYAWDGGRALSITLTLANRAANLEQSTGDLPVDVSWPTFLQPPAVTDCDWELDSPTTGTCYFSDLSQVLSATSATLLFPVVASGSGSGSIEFVGDAPDCAKDDATEAVSRDVVGQSIDGCNFNTSWLSTASDSFRVIMISIRVHPQVAKPGQTVAIIAAGIPSGAVLSLGWSKGTLRAVTVQSSAAPPGQQIWFLDVPRGATLGWRDLTMRMISWTPSATQREPYYPPRLFPTQFLRNALLLVPDTSQPGTLVSR